MALILCPHCEAVHEIEQPLQKMEGKKVRCASCRQIFAVQHEPSDAHALDITDLSAPFPALTVDNTHKMENGINNHLANKSQTPRSSTVFESDLPPEWDEPLNPDDLLQDDKTPFSVMSLPLDHQDRLETDIPAFEANHGVLTQADRPAAHQKRGAKKRVSARKFNPFAIFAPNANASTAKPAQRTMMMAAGFASLLGLGIARHDIVRVMPQTAPVFDVLGLPVNLYGLEFDEIKSRITVDAQGETLEITGVIRNVTRQVRPIPVLRLAIQNISSQDVFVWTANADIQELAAGEQHQFRRRLASPPQEAHRVVVRFLAKDDVITAIQ